MSQQMKKRKTPTQQTLDDSVKRRKPLNNNVDMFTTQNGHAGRIIRVHLQNFMCHDSLCIDMNSNINFIIGRNGSGKSAILTALVIGLGGKTSLTNRGSSVKGLIKVGKTSGSVEITLSNTGPLPYKPDKYGTEITITRSFSENGSSTYRLKSEHGVKMSDSVKEIRRIIDYMNIQIANPVCILNQDVSRSFLSTCDPVKQYMLFMRATNLENIQEQLEATVKNIINVNTILQQKNMREAELSKEINILYDKIEIARTKHKLQTRKTRLEAEVQFAEINVLKNEIVKIEKELEVINEDVKKLEDADGNRDARKKELKEQIAVIERKLLDIKTEEERNQSLLNAVRNELKKLNDATLTKNKEIDYILQGIVKKEADKNEINDIIKNQTDVSQRRMLIQQQQDEIKNLEIRISELKKMMAKSENDLMQNRNAQGQKQQQISNVDSELNELNNKIRKRESVISSMKSDKSNSITIYGPEMPRLLSAINAAKEQFSQTPRGPIGSYVKLTDKKWAVAVEDTIASGMLKSFCVNNHRDSQTLTKIFDKIYGSMQRPNIISSKFFHTVHNTAKHKTEAPKGGVPLLDVLQVSDPVVMNCLIDQLNIESVLLLDSPEIAYTLMSRKENVPRNCARALTVKGDIFYPDPNYRTYAGSSKGARYLQVSTADAIKQYEENLVSLKSTFKTTHNEVAEIKQELNKLRFEENKLDKRISQLHTAQNKLEFNLSELKAREQPAEPNVEALVDELNELTKIIESKHLEVDKLRTEISTIAREIEAKEQEIKQFRSVSKGLNEKLRPLINERNEVDNTFNKICVNAKYVKERIVQAKQKQVAIQSQHNETKVKLELKIEQSKNLEHQIDTDKSVEELLQEIDYIVKSLEKVRSLNEDENVLSKVLHELQKKNVFIRKQIKSHEKSLNLLKAAIKERKKNYWKLKMTTTVRIKEMFGGVLLIRNFSGSMEIDHENKTLELAVRPQHGLQGSGQTNTLSGGERTFSTIAFLHALWQVMEYPFYVLDEFDVFMDKVNRRAVMDLLLEHAKDHPELQFIFLTPQDVSNIEIKDNITIHRMADPIRKRTL